MTNSIQELNDVLTTINASLKATSTAFEVLSADSSNNSFYNNNIGPLLKMLNFDTTPTNKMELEKVSLLTLKNETMLSYINNLLLYLYEKLSIKSTHNDADRKEEDKFRFNIVEQRVVLERGIKPLEKKIGYQLDKLVRAYYRLTKEYEQAKQRSIKMEELGAHASSQESDESASDSDDEEMNYKPNIVDLGKAKNTHNVASSNKKSNSDNATEEDEQKIYKPPKISAVLPPSSTNFEDRFNPNQHKDRSGKNRMQAMEEYINQTNDKPLWEASIGTNILDHGRGGIKSANAGAKDKKIQAYEEDNFTRLNLNSKVNKRQKKLKQIRDKVNIIGGEDFSIFNNNNVNKKRNLQDVTSRRKMIKKGNSAWDRAKRRL
ncbi:related to U3 small nucleolar ribonucleoprotein protein LCP5 [Saccharomycodes ludwigii]|uniref:Related to U3 small nucleolar ribonucleoprotein protein LCP5 n=1 Tax=Saccharomycodes ludwigii TaxID=36035 RepID=A0A376B4V6_9ASCO|nr:related to U3 small nucleolar ribonucleoprotein protein LCP5 [Saccharomycodes ludwigii]